MVGKSALFAKPVHSQSRADGTVESATLRWRHTAFNSRHEFAESPMADIRHVKKVYVDMGATQTV